MTAICIGVSLYLLGVLGFARITRRTFGPDMGYKRWAPVAFGFLWPAIAIAMAREVWKERKES